MDTSSKLDHGDATDRLRKAAESPFDLAREWKQQTDRPVIGTFCSYVPDEVIIAAGALPVRIMRVPGEFGEADASLQAYACCLARGALQLGLTKGVDFLDGVVFANTCDTMQCLADIWLENVGGFVETFMMPVHIGHPAAREYTVAEVRRFADSLGSQLGVEISDDLLSQAATACRAARSALTRLQERRQGPSPILTARQYYDAMMARWVMPPEEFVPIIEAILSTAPSIDRTDPRIVIAGGPMYGNALPDLLDELGVCWVADDLCIGKRAATIGGEPTDDPIRTIADRLLDRPMCPTKHADDHDPGHVVVEAARQARADGVIVYRLKFCEPHSFDYPRVKRSLDQAGLPNMLLEVESPDSSIGQLRTRLQAFTEMLSETATSEGSA